MSRVQSQFAQVLENHEAKIELSPDSSKFIVSFTVDRSILRGVIDRWTFSDCTVTIRANDQEATLFFPKLQEQKKQ